MTLPVGTSLLSFSDQLTYALADDSCELPFCTKDTVDECLSYLNQEFVSIGLSSICRDGDTVESYHVTSLLNATNSLLQRFRRCAKSRDELQESKFRAETDLEHVQNDRKRLSSQLQQRERDLMQSQMLEKQLNRTNKILTGKLKMEKDEVRRLLVVMQNRDAQYKHAVRKKESELARLKERLHTLLIDSKTETKLGGSLEMSDVLFRTDGKRGRWKVSRNNVEDELYRSVISSHEEKHQQLIVENHELREILTYLLTEISALTVNCTHCKGSSRHNDQVHKTAALYTEENANNTFAVSDGDVSSCETTCLTPGRMSLPFTMIETDVKRELKQKITLLKNCLHTLEAASFGGCCGCVTRPSHRQSDADVPLRNYSLTHSADDQQQEEHRRWLMDENKAISTSQRLTASAGDAEMASCGVAVPTMSASELLQQCKQLNYDRKVFYEEMAEFEERKRQLAELECALNKQRIALEVDRCDQAVKSCQSSLTVPHRPRSAVAQSDASRRLIQDTPGLVSHCWPDERLLSNRDSELSSSSSRSLSFDMACDERQLDTPSQVPPVTSCCSVDASCHSSTSSLATSSLAEGNPVVKSSLCGNPDGDSSHSLQH